MPAGQRDWNAKCPAAVAKGLSPHLPAKNLPALRQGKRREGKQPPRRQQEFARERQAETKKASLTQALAGARRGRWHGQPTRALRSRRRRLLGASAGARLLRFLAARPQTRLEAAAQRPGTPSARCKLHATPQVFPSGRSSGAPPTTASFNHKRHELEALAVAELLRVLMGSLSPFVVGGSRPTTRSGGGKH